MAQHGTIPIPAVVTKPPRLRQTWISLLDKCPHSAFLNLKHDGGEESHQLHRGRVFHETVERATRLCVERGETTVPVELAKTIMEEVLLEHPDWIVPASELDDLRLMVHHWAGTFRCPVKPVVEGLFTLDVDGETVSGTVDLAWVEGDTLKLRDYKSGRNVAPADEVAGKDPQTGEPRGVKAPQLIVYSLLLTDGEPVDDVWRLPPGVNKIDAAFVYPYFLNAEEDGLVERGVVIDRSELIEHRSWLKLMVARAKNGFERGVWPAVSGRHCRWCPAPQECPIPPVLRGMQDLSPYERDASELAEELHFMEMDVKQRKAALKEYCTRYGPVLFGADLEASHKTVNTDPPSSRFGINKAGTGF